jgi:hypothetical protein
MSNQSFKKYEVTLSDDTKFPMLSMNTLDEARRSAKSRFGDVKEVKEVK